MHRIGQHVYLIPVRASVDREEEWKLRTPRQFNGDLPGSDGLPDNRLTISLLQTLTRISQVDARAQLMKHPKDTVCPLCLGNYSISSLSGVPDNLACTGGRWRHAGRMSQLDVVALFESGMLLKACDALRHKCSFIAAKC